jgi:hypothetical protein
MRFFVPALAAVSLAACSAESSGLDRALPALPDAALGNDAGVTIDGGSVHDASTIVDATTTPDAAIDAGPTLQADAAQADAAQADAAQADASSPDASPVDAGVPADSGVFDAGILDGGNLDAGRADAAAVPYGHTIVIDGVNDFTAAETFATSTVGYTLYVAWDTTYVYVGTRGSDVQSTATMNKWWLLYLAGDAPTASTGSTGGLTYNTQTPALPFPAAWHVRWKTTNDYTDAKSWVGGAWTDSNLSFASNVFRGSGNDFVEMRISRSVLGSPSTVRLVSAFINEGGGSEGTFAGAPSTAFIDGYNPAYTKAYVFTLAASPLGASLAP